MCTIVGCMSGMGFCHSALSWHVSKLGCIYGRAEGAGVYVVSIVLVLCVLVFGLYFRQSTGGGVGGG